MQKIVQEILSSAGIAVNGSNPWDIIVNDERFFRRVFSDGSLGLGESYMDNWWECNDLPEFSCRLLPSNPETRLKKNLKLLFHISQSVILNPGRRSKAYEIGKKHYDLGNELYKSMLDKRMVYSCAYWKNAKNLDEAQETKLDLICRKLHLQPGHRILDIGCGWGGLVKYAVENYGVKAVGVTVSNQQAETAKEICRGLPVEIRLQDYRSINEKFDNIVSVGMFEHVGYKNYRSYFEVGRRCLKDGGLFLLHTIGNDISLFTGDPWINKYIFPNSMIPSMKQISEAVEGLFIIEDVHNFGMYYDTTLCAWLDNFERNWEKLKGIYGERFYRMWKYYLQIFSGAFRSKYLQVWQIVLSKKGCKGEYQSIR
jgi:cyclopropane-fatty-acyl-phospholipid synthase